MNRYFRQIVSSRTVQEADAVIVTGDVTDRGKPEAWEVFWDAIDLAGLRSRVIVAPGNHDACCLGLRRRSAKNRELDMARMAKGLRMGGQPTRFPSMHRIHDDTVVFVLNSNNLGNTSSATNAVGVIAHFDLVRFAGLLYQFRDVPVKIVALHHSPNIPESQTALKRGNKPMSSVSRLAHQIPESERRALRLLCLSHRVRLVLHGHLHLEECRQVNGITIVGAPASTQPLDKEGGQVCRFWQYQIGGVSRRVTRRIVELCV
ncbi:MAG: metallophosphoesterase [Candidatus Hydrogenedentes bacterium]|nr:metallophosphoesterase [Candidatus Hydrogenedentota bacterium]